MADPDPKPMRFEPPAPVYLVDIDGDAILDPLRHRGDLQDGRAICIPSPWKTSRYLPGVARGKDGIFAMEVGDSFGGLAFDEEAGWVCRGLVPKELVVAGLAQEMVEQASGSSFTEKLVRKSAKSDREK